MRRILCLYPIYVVVVSLTYVCSIAVRALGYWLELQMGSDTPWPTAEGHTYQSEVWIVIPAIGVNTKISDIKIKGQS